MENSIGMQSTDNLPAYIYTKAEVIEHLFPPEMGVEC
jgi:hypothetical protein